jgi:integrase
MILVAFRHGLRASELCDLRWDEVESNSVPPCCTVRRVKNGTPSTHPLRGGVHINCEDRACSDGHSLRA